MTFESGFAETEKAAIGAAKAATGLKAAATTLRKAAATGDIARMHRAEIRLGEALSAVEQAATSAREAWPFSPQDEEAYLRDGYRQELIRAARAANLPVVERDDVILAFPSALRIDATGRSVRIGRTRHSELRPGHIVAMLQAARMRRPPLDSRRFLEVLWMAYRQVAGPEGLGTTVPLARIHDALTMLPWVAADYGRQEFAGDLLALNGSGIGATREGHQVAFPASTGTRTAPRETFVTVDARGDEVTFYAIRFTKAAR